MNTIEIRVYIWLLLILLGACTFSLLRLYNAIVVNSKMLILVKRTMATFTSKYRSITNDFTQACSKIATSVNQLKEVVAKFNIKK